MTRARLLKRALGSTRVSAWAIGLAGGAATVALSLGVGMTVRDALRVAGIAAGAGVAAGALGSVLLVVFRRWSMYAQAAVVVLTTVGAVAAGAAIAADAMFLADHDLHQLFVILLAVGTAGVLVAMTLGRRVVQGSLSLREATRRIGQGQALSQVERPATAELASLAEELESMSRRLDEARQREQALDASRRELVAWVSHDLRTPLAGIRAMVEALEDGVVADPETVARYHRMLRMETDRLAQLVDDLFELSVIQAGALRLELERASLSDVVSDSLATASVMAQAKGVRLQGRIDGRAPEIVLSIPGVSRVLRNLLENAIRLTPSDGTVSIESGVDGDRAYVSVSDECGGIPEREVTRLFDLAFRSELARTPREPGSAGLGLAIARGIVEAHHGEISVRNAGPGCRFTVRLPLSTSTGATAGSGTAAGVPLPRPYSWRSP